MIIFTDIPVTEETATPSRPLIIKLLKETKWESEGQGGSPVVVLKPSILKVILLQMEATPSDGSQTMNSISLSEVHLRYDQNKWSLSDGHSYHGPPQDGDATELYVLPGGIQAVYNLTQNCWHVLPPVQSEDKQQEPINSDSKRLAYLQISLYLGIIV